MRSVIDAVADRTLLYIAYHSFGEMILIPYGYTYALPGNFREMKSKGQVYAGNMTTKYKVGSGSEYKSTFCV
jgi:hypothetical protein